MGINKKEVSLNTYFFLLKNIFKDKGYPEKFFKEGTKYKFSYKSFVFEFEIPLIIEQDFQSLFIADYKLQKNLTFSERGIIALARVFFDPLPYFALITNFKEFILLNLYTTEKQKGNKDIIPEYKSFQFYQPKEKKPFKLEIERKILAIYLSGG